MIPDYYYRGMKDLRDIKIRLSLIKDEVNKIMPGAFQDDGSIIDKPKKEDKFKFNFINCISLIPVIMFFTSPFWVFALLHFIK